MRLERQANRSWQQWRDSGDIFSIEFTVNRYPGGDQYYSSVLRYKAGTGFLTHEMFEQDARYAAGGLATVSPCSAKQSGVNGNELAQAAKNLSLENLEDFLIGREIFHRDFHVAGFNVPPSALAGACNTCHVNDSRTNPPVSGQRSAPLISGTGLLEAIADDVIETLAANSATGRIHRVNSVVLGANAIGRFGWKASSATVSETVARAFHHEMGLSNSLVNDNADNDSLAVDDQTLDITTTYVRGLGIPRPMRKGIDYGNHDGLMIEDPQTLNDIQAGIDLFDSAGCASCHIPEINTGNNPRTFAEYRNLTIRPFTDLLLHDMGEELAENTEGEASARQWRTAPLWGARNINAAGGEEAYMHDGRAATVRQAILLHGGDSAFSREAFLNAPENLQQELIDYVESL